MLIEPHTIASLKNNEITELYLFGKDLSEQSAIYLAFLLKTNTSLVRLNLEYNGLGPEVGFAFAEMLEENSTLQQLNFRANQLGENATQALIDVLKKHNKTLLMLDVKGNASEYIEVDKIPVNDFKKQTEITTYLDRNKALKFFDNLKKHQVDKNDLLFWNSKVKSGGASFDGHKIPHTIANLLKNAPSKLTQEKSKQEKDTIIRKFLSEPSGSCSSFFGNDALYRSKLIQKLRDEAEEESNALAPCNIPMAEI